MLNKLPKELLIKIIVERENVDHINNYDDVCDEISKIYTIREKLVEKKKQIWDQKHKEVINMFDSSILDDIRNWSFQGASWCLDYKIVFKLYIRNRYIIFNFDFDFFLLDDEISDEIDDEIDDEIKINDKINDKINNEINYKINECYYNYTIFRSKKVRYRIVQSVYLTKEDMEIKTNYTLEEFIEEYPIYETFLEICSNKDLSKYIFKEPWD